MASDDQQQQQGESIFDPSTCTRRGTCPVVQLRHQHRPLESHALYFEVHGSGPQKIVFIMGVHSSSFGWLSQVEYFSKLEQYSTLVFDNRGVGMSGSPRGPYSTSGMANDVVCLLDYLEWTEDRSLHVVGVSMGGMIAQELADRIPDRIMSLSLVVTRAGENVWNNIPPLPGWLLFMKIFLTSDPEQKISIVLKMLFPDEWLDAVAEGDEEGRTNREIEWEHLRQRTKITKPQTLVGALGQMVACMTHRVTPSRLAKISASVPKVLILSAAEDMLVPRTKGEDLELHMPEAEYQRWEKTGHALYAQYKERFNRLLERVFKEGKEEAERRAASD